MTKFNKICLTIALLLSMAFALSAGYFWGYNKGIKRLGRIYSNLPDLIDINNADVAPYSK